MFKKAIVRTPSRSMVKGLTSADLGIPDYDLALEQHRNYIEALRECGLQVFVLPPDENYPDSTFVEDTALLTSKCAIIANPGAPSRKGEVTAIRNFLNNHYSLIEKIEEPGTMEPGDIMMAGNHFYIGMSKRTNEYGAAQTMKILDKFGFSSSVIPLKDILHLKTGISYLENNTLLASGELLKVKEFKKFKIIKVDNAESYSANSVWINNRILIPRGYPKTRDKIIENGYSIIELDVSEFRKLDGGLSCLSLRF